MTESVEVRVAKIEMVKEIVLQAMRFNPSTDAVGMTERLFGAADRGVAVTTLDLPNSIIPKHVPMPVPVDPVTVEVPEFAAPYPESAMGGDTYDPIEAIRCLPDFERLPREFGKEHSVIRVGSQTVVMNAAHYADFLAIREIVDRANADVEVYRRAAELSAQTVSDLEALIDVDFVTVNRNKHQILAAVWVSCNGEYGEAETVRAAVQQCIEKVRAAKAVDDLQKAPLHPVFEPLPTDTPDQPVEAEQLKPTIELIVDADIRAALNPEAIDDETLPI